MTSEATVRLEAKGERLVAVGEGNGPVNALDTGAARRRWSRSTPSSPSSSSPTTRSASWPGRTAPAAVTRVLIDSDDGTGQSWSTVGVDENIIAASWHALEEAVTYCLLRSGREPS